MSEGSVGAAQQVTDCRDEGGGLPATSPPPSAPLLSAVLLSHGCAPFPGRAQRPKTIKWPSPGGTQSLEEAEQGWHQAVGAAPHWAIRSTCCSPMRLTLPASPRGPEEQLQGGYAGRASPSRGPPGH